MARPPGSAWIAAGAALASGSAVAHASGIGWGFAQVARVLTADEAAGVGYGLLGGALLLAAPTLALFVLLGAALSVAFWSRLESGRLRKGLLAAPPP